jgi:formylmethanofuran dehydrogenase subunit C
MMDTKRTAVADGVICASRRLKVYGPMAEEPVRGAAISGSPAILKMTEAWDRLGIEEYRIGDAYDKAVSLVRGLRYSSGDVESFCISLAGRQGEPLFPQKAGTFLSALINCGKAKRYRLTIPGGLEIDYLGSANTKELLVLGDVRHGIGLGMESGKITLRGNASGSAGWSMRGGELVICGSCVEAGPSMEGGRIIVRGSVAGVAGNKMEGGRIEVLGDCPFAGPQMKGGELLIHGASRGIGNGMSGGSITILGDLSADHKCEHMKGGEVRIEGLILSRFGFYAPYFEGGKIYHRGKLVAGK